MTDIDLLSQIMDLNTAWMDDFKRGDAKAVGEHYTNDAISLPPHSGAVIGKAAIIDYWRRAMDSGAGGLNIQSKEVERAGERVIEIGETELLSPDKEILDRFNYMLIWKNRKTPGLYTERFGTPYRNNHKFYYSVLM